MVKIRRIVTIAIGLGLLGQWEAALALPSDPVSLGTYKDWEAFTYEANNTPVCYIYSTPSKSSASKKVLRDPVYVLITHYSGRKPKGQVSTIIGYPFKDSSKARLEIDGSAYDLFTNGDSAWIGTPTQEQAVIAALKSAQSLTIIGTSWKGTETTDTYSLNGFSQAMDKIDRACK